MLMQELQKLQLLAAEVIQVQYQRHLKLQKLNRRYRLRNLIIRKLLEAKVLN